MVFLNVIGEVQENNDSEELEDWPPRQRDRNHLKQKQQNTHIKTVRNAQNPEHRPSPLTGILEDPQRGRWKTVI